MQRLKKFYFSEVVPSLQKEFLYKNSYQIPQVKKIVINRGFDESCQNQKLLNTLLDELTLVSGQKAIITRSKQAIASFKIKENMPVGMFLTLRGEKMYGFLDRLINLSLPRIRDFQGLNLNSFDGSGNYTLGLNDQLLFPEIEFDKVVNIQGMDISIITTANSDKEALFLLKQLGMPFK